MIIRIVYYNNYATYLGKSFRDTVGGIRRANNCLSSARAAKQRREKGTYRFPKLSFSRLQEAGSYRDLAPYCVAHTHQDYFRHLPDAVRAAARYRDDSRNRSFGDPRYTDRSVITRNVSYGIIAPRRIKPRTISRAIPRCRDIILGNRPIVRRTSRVIPSGRMKRVKLELASLTPKSKIKQVAENGKIFNNRKTALSNRHSFRRRVFDFFHARSRR
ncbi:hypothetical protein PUN28_003862 [Cardiocondyla obscurior]|uniref:Uncharacterized protein n=1 Tax=Cardiocondyla obscurior TaxID=286306 RepID=A0AAW2GL54_9HYME